MALSRNQTGAEIVSSQDEDADETSSGAPQETLWGHQQSSVEQAVVQDVFHQLGIVGKSELSQNVGTVSADRLDAER